MNEGWAPTAFAHDDRENPRPRRDHRLRRQRSGVLATAKGSSPLTARRRALSPIEERLEQRSVRQGLGRIATTSYQDATGTCVWYRRRKSSEVRSLYMMYLHREFLTRSSGVEQKMFTYTWSTRNGRFEYDTRVPGHQRQAPFQADQTSSPFIYVLDANFKNRSELAAPTRSSGGRPAP